MFLILPNDTGFQVLPLDSVQTDERQVQRNSELYGSLTLNLILEPVEMFDYLFWKLRAILWTETLACQARAFAKT
ncbi:hypothetical protein V5J35_000948 [Endozoicomonas sp. NE40]|uniref:Uncharacterized protein n=1 Tax=Endozoicomonas lisbonensis TaxID=3120522 RepID=A0ABV2SDB1_9GAMM